MGNYVFFWSRIRALIFLSVLLFPALGYSEPTLESLSSEDRLRVQIYLDQSGFSPGLLDGSMSDFTLKAATRWKSRDEGRIKSGMNYLIDAAKESVKRPYRSYEIRKTDLTRVGKVPFTLREKARKRSLPYSRLSELIAEKFHCGEEMLARLNPALNLKKIAVGTKVTVPDVLPFDVGVCAVSDSEDRAENSIVIVWSENILEVRDSKEKLIACYPVTLGSKASHVRNGRWTIGNFTPNPKFRWDDSVMKDGVVGRNNYLLPPGANNPVGVLWLGLDRPDGNGSHIGIHGTNHPETVGRSHSSGCIRLTNWDIVRLAQLIGVNSFVEWRK